MTVGPSAGGGDNACEVLPAADDRAHRFASATEGGTPTRCSTVKRGPWVMAQGGDITVTAVPWYSSTFQLSGTGTDVPNAARYTLIRGGCRVRQDEAVGGGEELAGSHASTQRGPVRWRTSSSGGAGSRCSSWPRSSNAPTWPSVPGPERTAEIRWRTARPPWTLFVRPVRRGRRPLIPVTSAQQGPEGPPLSWISSATDG
jgi:hypothetical protein